MSKKKPDYTKFMRKPAPLLRMSPPTEKDGREPARGPVREEDIPWAEIVEACSPPAPETPAPPKSAQPQHTVEEQPGPAATSGRRSFFAPLDRLCGALERLGPLRARLSRAATGPDLWRATLVPGTGIPPLPAFLVVLVLLFLMIYTGGAR
jgi:hypothetical protein